MQQTLESGPASLLRHIPREVVTIVVIAAAIFAVVALGSLIASALPADAHSPWLVIASYAAPAAVAFVIYWWTDQRH
jgi:cyanate permease